ncbi:MAG: DUF3592 domain-containing protein [Chloroflexi bacterium]|nr:DUF3592 domain-containing protein [Chloroflexota bacterium]
MTDSEQNFLKHLIVLIIGLFLLLVGGVKLTLTGSFVSTAVTTEGTVVGLSEEVNVAPGGTFDTYLEVEFRTSEGRLVRFKDQGPPVDVGDKVDVLYNPVDSSQSRVRDFWKLWGWWAILVVIGTVMVIWSTSRLRSRRETP